MDASDKHPLIRLSQSIPWKTLVDTILPDLKKTKKGCWWLGRKLKIRTHLGVYLLQQIFNKTDRQIEYDVKDNAAYQLFCGIDIVEKWHAPDHTKIEEFRSRLSEETQKSLANLMAKQAALLGFADPAKVLSFHLKEAACFTKGKLGKKYQFGRCVQLGRIDGNFLFVTKSTSVHMNDKTSLPEVITCHQALFDNAKINSVATDKGYYSKANEKYLPANGVTEIGIQRPNNIKTLPIKSMSKEREEALVNRRSGIEPLIGHVKQGGQPGRSRMKSDKGIECSGYTAVLGFNMRQFIKCQKPPNQKKSA